MKIDVVLDKYMNDIILYGEKEADKRLLADLKIGIHADAFFEVIKVTYEAYKKEKMGDPSGRMWN
jgi:hypothetical protein